VSADGSPDDLELTTEQLLQKIRSNELSVDTFAWQSKMENWRPIREIEELAVLVDVTPPKYDRTGGFLGTGMELSLADDHPPVVRPPAPRRDRVPAPRSGGTLQGPPRAVPKPPSPSAPPAEDTNPELSVDFGWPEVGAVAPPPSIDVDDLVAPPNDGPPNVDLSDAAESVPPDSRASGAQALVPDLGERASQPRIDVESVLEAAGATESVRTSRPPPLPSSSQSEPPVGKRSAAERELRAALAERRRERGQGLSGLGRAAGVVAVLAAGLWWLAREQSLPLLVGEPTLVEGSATTVHLSAQARPEAERAGQKGAATPREVAGVPGTTEPAAPPPRPDPARRAASPSAGQEPAPKKKRASEPAPGASDGEGEATDRAESEPREAAVPRVERTDATGSATKDAQESEPVASAPREAKREPVATTPFSAESARSALDAAASRASSCRRDGEPSGVARVTITFASSGRVTSAAVAGPPFAGTPTGGCIASSMRGARVPAFAGDHVTVTKTVVIQ
jgi:hypothetical protein